MKPEGLKTTIEEVMNGLNSLSIYYGYPGEHENEYELVRQAIDGMTQLIHSYEQAGGLKVDFLQGFAFRSEWERISDKIPDAPEPK